MSRLRLWLIRQTVCRWRGHYNSAWMLPEAEFGLYAYSRLFCGRCDLTFERRAATREGGEPAAPREEQP